MEVWFDHEKLRVYQAAIAFCSWWETVGARLRIPATVRDQLDRASTSVALNIAEGNGKYSFRDRGRYLQIATGSALERAACLDVLAARRRLDPETLTEGKSRLRSIVSMLIALINSTADRVQEPFVNYDFTTPKSGLGPSHLTPTLTPTPTRRAPRTTAVIRVRRSAYPPII